MTAATVAVARPDGDEDAVPQGSDSPFGLSGSVWSEDRVPCEGTAQSGIGRELGVAGFEEYPETKPLAEPA